ncbi:LysR family transcriptional regulator [Myroides odoratimimus]|uniref:LysR family transcriptional regulator n=1 Tax=Myroides odoratimimus TaxID=76832 RepID=UPI0004689B0F|nr:LysR family transcriptional regulator [Myroides odoratimimus]MDM1414321.1 LysR family transcriptional regulator [Myroides odoratimimus]MDM1446798.1 LysR family transcriptional regulator [Myroides odoratimimus]MDM1457698.1 LysR family transcriptional regulator [Myroides odoratimimus]MDO5858019.1 LysR family transcriptional regulator [Myroides odoratimimus]MEC4007878.1 LysR family transcriptional regulator [Myroides odoratimimus]
MFDFRLKVFYTVAKRGSFTKASKELLISQPAVTKHIQEIEANYQTKLFVRDGMKIHLTEAGKLLYTYAEEIFSIYRNLEFDIHALNAKMDGSLRVGASTTISQYVLPPLLAEFRKKVNDLHLDVVSDNTNAIENLLLNKTIDVGLVEGYSKNPQIKYIDFIKDEIVLVCSSNNELAKRGSIKPQELKELSFLLRETGSGTLDVVDTTLKEIGITLSDLTNEMNFSSTESIKMYLMHSDSVAFLSVHAILKELRYNELSIVDIEGLDISRTFSLIQRQGQESALVELFIRFVQNHNLKL